MKTKLVFTVFLSSLLILYGCSQNEDNVQEPQSESQNLTTVKGNSASKGSSVINQTYPQAQQKVLETFGAIGQVITAGAGSGYYSEYMDQLISFHAYGDKFTEFNDGKLFDSAGNEENERSLFGDIVDPGGVKQFATVPETLKVAVYHGNVANVTFISDFILQIGGVDYTFNNLITLLFVKTKGKWKIVHEHHSPADNGDSVEESGLASKASGFKSTFGSKSSVIDQTYPQAQQEVLETFGAIGQVITAGAGSGYYSEYMDQLISFHAYGDKFTEFNDGKLFDSAGNEENERSLFGDIVDPGGVKQFATVPETLKVAVYHGNVANVTFISDFILQIGGVDYTFNNLITLLFVKTKGKWKIVHEHHSPAE